MIVIAAAALAGLAGCTSGGGQASGQPSGNAARASSSPAASGTPAPTTSAAEILDRAMAALRSAGSAHITFVSKDGSQTSVISQDSGTDGGRQVITIDGNGHTTVLFLGGVGYVEANETALTTYYGFAANETGSLPGRWISFQPGAMAGGTGWSAVTSGITLASVASEVTLTGALTLTGPTRIDGHSVIGMRGTPTGQYPAGVRATLYVAASGRPLPVSYQIDSHGIQDTVMFGQWGEPLNLSAPTGAIAATAIRPLAV
jgi:hypothetical protein